MADQNRSDMEKQNQGGPNRGSSGMDTDKQKGGTTGGGNFRNDPSRAAEAGRKGGETRAGQTGQSDDEGEGSENEQSGKSSRNSMNEQQSDSTRQGNKNS